MQDLGTTSMAELWKATSVNQPGKLVLIKRLAEVLAADRAFTTMFLDEAKTHVHVRHPNVVESYDLGMVHERYYLALEYLPGVTAQALVERGVPVAAACLVVARAALGLDHAHNLEAHDGPLGIIHRNVTPLSVLVGFDGQVKVTDFAIARARRRVTQTDPGVLKGVIGYLSPELARGEPIDERVDVFGLGVVLHELLTGQRLLQGTSEYDTLMKTRAARFEPPSRRNPLVPAALDAVVLRALESKPTDRFASAAELAGELEPFLFADGAPFDEAALAAYLRGAFAEELARTQAEDAAALR